MPKSVIKIIHTTISPCDNERRIFNQAITAYHQGYSVEILALKTPELPEISKVNQITIKRIAIRFWRKGPLKFLSFNIKLFFRLLKCDFHILHVHDLWVIPGSALANFFKKGLLVYDAHEYFRGLEVFQQKKISGFIWTITERLFIKRISALIVINGWHQRLFLKDYPSIKKSTVIMNFPNLTDSGNQETIPGFEQRYNIAIFQGILKKGRGLHSILSAMERVKSGKLQIIGFGELESELRHRINTDRLQNRIHLRGKVAWSEILQETQKARAGLVLFEPLSVNYTYASPNKFFEYVMAGTPLIASRIPTFEEFNREFEVALLVDPSRPEEIASAIEFMLTRQDAWETYHQNCLKARLKWNWETQGEALIQLYQELAESII